MNVLDQDLSKTPIRFNYSDLLYRTSRLHPCLTGIDFYHIWVINEALEWDIVTYSLGYLPLTRVRRIIHSIGTPLFPNKIDKSRVLRLSHTKLWLAYSGGSKKPIAAFIGSMNFVPPTLNELMIMVPQGTIKSLTKYFQSLWTLAK